MTREEAIKIIEVMDKRYMTLESDERDALNMAIQALHDLEEIKGIINAPVYIQEDVIRYKMICEVVK